MECAKQRYTSCKKLQDYTANLESGWAETSQDLTPMVDTGRFREDLFYRLNVVRMELPPLTERRDDLPLLIHHVLRELSAARALPPPMISEKAMQALLNYTCPGNVREMENILEHALILCRNEPIREEKAKPRKNDKF